MPLIQFSMSCRSDQKPSASDIDTLLSEASRSAAGVLGKSEAVMMVRLAFDDASFGASTDPSCCVCIRQIGPFEDAARSELARVLTWQAAERLGVVEERVFVLFEGLEGTHWAKGGRLCR